MAGKDSNQQSPTTAAEFSHQGNVQAEENLLRMGKDLLRYIGNSLKLSADVSVANDLATADAVNRLYNSTGLPNPFPQGVPSQEPQSGVPGVKTSAPKTLK